MIYTNLFIVDLNYMQSIKQLADNEIDYALYDLLYDKFEAFIDGPPSVGYTCPKATVSWNFF